MAAVEGSSAVRVVEDAIAADMATTIGAFVESKVATTTGVVVETKVEAAFDTAEASERRARKEVVADVPLGP